MVQAHSYMHENKVHRWNHNKFYAMNEQLWELIDAELNSHVAQAHHNKDSDWKDQNGTTN